jgi:hypothetical protein
VHQILRDRFPVVQNLRDPVRPGLFLHSDARVVKKITLQKYFPAKKSGAKVPGPKKITADQRKTRKNNPSLLTLSTERRNHCQFFAQPIEPGTLALKCRQPNFFRPEILRTEKFSV